MRRSQEQLRAQLAAIADSGLDFVDFATAATEAIATALSFDRSCWHTVDPGTVLFTSTVTLEVGCSAAWLAEHEYVIDDVNQWHSLARSGRIAGRTSAATGGDLGRCIRHRSTEALGIGDELRVSLVLDGVYWGAAGFLRDADRPWFTEDDERLAFGLVGALASGCRRAVVTPGHVAAGYELGEGGAGVLVLGPDGEVESITPAAVRWLEAIPQEPVPAAVHQTTVVQSVAAQIRARPGHADPLASPAKARVRTASGVWLLVYAAPLAGTSERTAVVIHPATTADVAPVVASAYGLTPRESEVARLCMTGGSTKEIAAAMRISPYTVQDHLKAIFEKTGVRTRNELVGEVFLNHYASRWDRLCDTGGGWVAYAAPEIAGARKHQ